jgi:3'(2'), 5'-bisphosphate nucleotidase
VPTKGTTHIVLMATTLGRCSSTTHGVSCYLRCAFECWTCQTPTMTRIAPADDHAFAAWLAERAGEILLEVREQGLTGRELKDAGDASAQELIARLLGEHRPADAVLSEEATDDRLRLGADRVWIIDPLDGTREYSELGRTDWAVHVALWERGDLVAGAIAQPALGQTLATGAPPPAPDEPLGTPRLAVSRTRASETVLAVADALGAELIPMGSAGVKVAAVIRGEVDAYLHTGGQYEWDSAAPVAVARATGLFTSRADGSPLAYNQPDVSLPDVLVCRPELAERILDLVARLG